MSALTHTLNLGRRLTQRSSRAVHALRHRPWRAAGTFQWIAWAALVMALVASSKEGTWHHTPLLHGRAVIDEWAETIRSVHWRVATSHRPMELQLDPARGCMFVVSFEGRNRVVEVVERTLWLPETLQMIEAPKVLRVAFDHPHEPTTILLLAPTYSRVFRLTVFPDGRVVVQEEAAL